MCLPDVLARFLPFASIRKVTANVWTFFSQPPAGQASRGQRPSANLLEIHEIVLGAFQSEDTWLCWFLVGGLPNHLWGLAMVEFISSRMIDSIRRFYLLHRLKDETG